MIICFIIHVKEDATYAEEIRLGLEGQGYHCWREPTRLEMDALLFPSTTENALLGSAVALLLWRKASAGSEGVKHLVRLAQHVKKQIVPVLLDDTALPAGLTMHTPIVSQGSSMKDLVSIVAELPAADDPEPFFAVVARAAHAYPRERKAAIGQASDMLRRGEQREALLALLQYLAEHDVMDGVRTQAQEAIDMATASERTGFPVVHPGEAKHIFGVRCKNGHISYFDKRYVCKISTKVPRALVQQEGKKLDELHLKCDTCGEKVTAYVDCEAYR